MPEMKEMRFKDLEVGDVWFVCEPRRLVMAIGKETVRVTEDRKTFEVDAMRLKATIPTFPIPDQIDARQAVKMDGIRRNQIASCANEPFIDAVWEEVWSERFVPPVKADKKAGGTLVIDEDSPQIPQLYCHHQEKQVGNRARHNFRARGQISGVKVDLSIVPAYMFDTPDADVIPVPMYQTMAQARNVTVAKAEEAGDTTEVKEMPKLIRPKGTAELRGLAAGLGIDVSDCTGKGSGDKIWKRITELQVA